MATPVVPIIALTLVLATTLAGCSASSQQGASQGAKTGAVGGMVAGAVGSIFWGGDAVNNALRAGAVGAASGAAVGAMSAGSSAPATTPVPPPVAPAPPPPVQGQPRPLSESDAALEARIGAANFSAGEELAQCRHVSAIARAQRAFSTETDQKRREYSLLIQAMAAEESGNAGMADAVYSQWGQLDPAYADPNKARAAALDGILKVQRIRQERGWPVLCT
jgi:hypothetical protein